MKTINQAAGEFGRTEKQLDTVFSTFWPQLEQAIQPKLQQLKRTPRKAEVQQQETDRILQELLLLNRQQLRKLSNPDELFGKELLGLPLRIVHEPEGAAIRLANNERDLAMALCGDGAT
ncbi:hypothetical protein IVB41_10570 [Bradyrhizobium sp. 44]|uniref:hypothetical protein n=1 Tax=Bradyrhizobium sp. 44 TaxID=2782675 RepID=UPI001FF9A9C8|nr:hypothetical protein [Bradyrhizobium sp. 44]MCK1284357.1 hypothetical protein [Bradyrhizobium sp. 44]